METETDIATGRMNDFVRGSNVDLFLDRLARTRDDRERQTLLRLLIEEEDRFGKESQFHVFVERLIADNEKRIKSQRELIASLKQSGRDAEAEEFVLVTFLTTQALFMRKHHQLTRSF